MLSIAGLMIMVASVSSAQQKPFSQWSEGEKQALASQLGGKANQECGPYKQQAQGGSVRATYEAAACVYGTFFLGTPADYPNREQYRKQFYENAQHAKDLGSSVPILKFAQ